MPGSRWAAIMEKLKAEAGVKDKIAKMLGITVKDAEKVSPEMLSQMYAKSKGLKLSDVEKSPIIIPEGSREIAKVYENLKHDPTNPDVKRAYDALIKETGDQFKLMRDKGVKMSEITPGMQNPYSSSKDLINDIKNNNHLYYYPTDQGFGSTPNVSNHPLLGKSGEKIGDKELLNNDIFRIVHDYFGHGVPESTFGPRGEEAAWLKHRQMYSPEAQKALVSETRGQNSWVNFGPHGEANRVNPKNTIYAEQKAGLLPEWVNDAGYIAPESIKPKIPINGLTSGIISKNISNNSTNMSPIPYLSDAASAYKSGLGKVHDTLANEMDFTKDKSTKEDLKAVMGLILDPVNLIPGAAGVGAGALQLLGDEKDDSSWRALQKYLNNKK